MLGLQQRERPLDQPEHAVPPCRVVRPRPDEDRGRAVRQGDLVRRLDRRPDTVRDDVGDELERLVERAARPLLLARPGRRRPAQRAAPDRDVVAGRDPHGHGCAGGVGRRERPGGEAHDRRRDPDRPVRRAARVDDVERERQVRRLARGEVGAEVDLQVRVVRLALRDGDLRLAISAGDPEVGRAREDRQERRAEEEATRDRVAKVVRRREPDRDRDAAVLGQDVVGGVADRASGRVALRPRAPGRSPAPARSPARGPARPTGPRSVRSAASARAGPCGFGVRSGRRRCCGQELPQPGRVAVQQRRRPDRARPRTRPAPDRRSTASRATRRRSGRRCRRRARARGPARRRRASASGSSTARIGRPSSATENFASGKSSFQRSSVRYDLRRPSPRGGARCAQTIAPIAGSRIRVVRRSRRTRPSSVRSHATMPSRSSAGSGLQAELGEPALDVDGFGHGGPV